MKRAMFIGQAMPRGKRDLHDWQSLNNWLYSIDISDKQIRKYFYYSALVDYFPGSKGGSHLVPTKKEIEAERPRLKKTITTFKPDIIVPIGRLSIAHCLNRKVEPLRANVGKIYQADPYMLFGNKLPVIPLPHPSGASTWKHNKYNMELLHQSLEILKQNSMGKS